MTYVVIGSDGFIGSQMAKRLPDAILTTHKPQPYLDGRWPFDLLQFGALPDGDIVFMCAGVNGQKKCEGNPESHHVNVDAQIKLAKHYVSRGAFPVFLSSRSLEWSNSAYSRQKALAEMAMVNLPMAIVRAGRVTQGNVQDLCDTMIRVGIGRIEGVTVWGTDDIAYREAA